MYRHFNIIIAVIAFFSCSIFTAQSAVNDKSTNYNSIKAQKKKIVFVAGKDSHGRGDHEFKAGCHLLARLLNESRPDIDAVVTDNGWPEDLSIFDGADVIVMYSDGADGHMVIPHLEEVDKLVKKGIGIVAMHYAIEVPKGKAGDYFYNWIGGYFEAYYSVNPFFIPEFVKLPKHQITNGVKPFKIRDEWYYHLRFADKKKITPILSAHPPVSTLLPEENSARGNNEFVRKDLQDGKIQTMAWAFERPDGGRSFGFSGGHTHSNWADDDFRKLILNAIVWTAKLKVPDNGIVTKTPSATEMEYLLKAPRPSGTIQPQANAPAQPGASVRRPGVPVASGSRSDISPPNVKVDSLGFVPIFDGKTLNGWDGDQTFWRVENGEIVGETTPEKVVKVNNFVIWRGGTIKDFELKVDFKINGTNSGIQYRSTELPEIDKWVLKGYQADLELTNGYTGNIHEERGRTGHVVLSKRGR